jgi:glucose-1-phosphatase
LKAILFDLGRVLVHYDHQATLTATAALWQLTVDEFGAIMQDVGESLGNGAMDAETFYNFLRERTARDLSFEAFITAFAAGIQRDDSALTYALSLQQRSELTVAIMSNTNAAHVLWLDEHLPELREFDLVMMSNEVGLTKPDPAVFELALELLDILPEQAIFIDDIAANVDAARTLGMAGIVHQDWHVTRPAIEAWLDEP